MKSRGDGTSTLSLISFILRWLRPTNRFLWDDPQKSGKTIVPPPLKKGDSSATIPGPHVKRILDKVEVLSSAIMAAATEEFDEWIDDTKTATHEVDDSHGKRVTDAYFAGDDPFKSPKRRDDFPDAFIYQAVQDLAEQHGSLHVIIADHDLRESCERLEKVTAHRNIKTFIGLPECQVLILELDEVLKNIDRVRKLLPQENELLQDNLDAQIVDLLPDTMIWVSGIRSAHNEATVESIGTPREGPLNIR